MPASRRLRPGNAAGYAQMTSAGRFERERDLPRRGPEGAQWHLRSAALAHRHAAAYTAAVSRIPDNPLDPRARQLLRTLIARHIRDGEPVGSQTLARHAGLDVSPATIRNILSDLEELGLLSAPHTSAGRVPTSQGYRVFVDSLLQVRPLPEAEISRLRNELPAGSGTQSLLGSASELVSAMTHFVGVVSVPKRAQFAFRHIDFVPLDGNRVMTILVFADHEVQNRIVQTRRPYEPGELERVANYLNVNFAGRPLADIRATLLQELRVARNEMESLLSQTAELTEQVLDEPAPDGEHASDDMVLSGQTRLIGVQDLADLDRLRELFEAFARKREILQLLDRTVRAPGVRIFIGEETGLAPLEGVSLVTAPYMAGGRVLGVLGVIGPTRMAYERVIPVVQAAADVLGHALGDDPGLNRERPTP
jgi:heat-inducible transcriptional repressor